MPKYTVRRTLLLWEEASVEADNEEAAIDKAYAQGFAPAGSDTGDVEVWPE